MGLADSAGNSLFSANTEWQDDISKEIEDQIINEYRSKSVSAKETCTHVFSDAIPIFMEGVESIVKDSFTESFRPRPPSAWNWNLFLFLTWTFGTFVR